MVVENLSGDHGLGGFGGVGKEVRPPLSHVARGLEGLLVVRVWRISLHRQSYRLPEAEPTSVACTTSCSPSPTLSSGLGRGSAGRAWRRRALRRLTPGGKILFD